MVVLPSAQEPRQRCLGRTHSVFVLLQRLGLLSVVQPQLSPPPMAWRTRSGLQGGVLPPRRRLPRSHSEHLPLHSVHLPLVHSP